MATVPEKALSSSPNVAVVTGLLVIFISLMTPMDVVTLKEAEGSSAAREKVTSMASRSVMIRFFLMLYILSG